MPGYMYADSTEFDLQRDFVDLLERYADMAIEAVPTQAEILDLRKRLVTVESRMNSIMSSIDQYEKGVLADLEATTKKFGEEGYPAVAGDIAKFVEQRVSQFRDARKKEMERELATIRAELERKEMSLLHTIGEFLYHDPLQVTESKITAKLSGKAYESKLEVQASSGVEYGFALDFAQKELRVQDLTKKEIEVPAEMRATMLSKEKKPRFVEIHEWVLSEAEFLSNGETSLHAVLMRDPKEPDSFRLEMEVTPGETKVRCLNFVDEDGKRTDILKEEQLRKSLGTSLDELSKYLLGHFFGAASRKKGISHVSVDGRDVIDSDLTDTFVEVIAREYGPTVLSIRERGLVENELNLKAEDLEGRRTEIYLKIDDYRSKLAAIPQGEELCTLLGLD